MSAECRQVGYRQGDVVLVKVASMVEGKKQKLKHTVLAEGEITGHKHEVTEGEATLYQVEETMYLKVDSDTATITHQEHKPVTVKKGIYTVEKQREYTSWGERSVSD